MGGRMFASHVNEVGSSHLQKLYANWAYGTTLSIWINTFSEVLCRLQILFIIFFYRTTVLNFRHMVIHAIDCDFTSSLHGVTCSVRKDIFKNELMWTYFYRMY